MKPFFIALFFISVNSWALAPSPPIYESVLFVGDSHSAGAFGDQIDKYLRSVSSEVESVAVCGSSPSTWVASGTIKSTNCGYWSRDRKGHEVRTNEHKVSSFTEELTKTRPDLTVIAMGTNVLTSSADILREKASMEKMLEEVDKAKSKCVWVGPPNLRKKPYVDNLKEGIKMLKAVAEKHGCTFIDSTIFTKYPSNNNDGIHYGPRASAKWGVATAKEIERTQHPNLKQQQQMNTTPTPNPSDRNPR